MGSNRCIICSLFTLEDGSDKDCFNESVVLL